MIIDASIAFKWIVPEEGSEQAVALLDNPNLAAPFLILSEVGNAIGKRIRRGLMLDTPDLRAMYGQLGDLLECVPESQLMERAFAMSLDLQHVLYDCVYLALAEEREVRLLTADARFAAKVATSPWATLIEPWVDHQPDQP